MDLIGIGKRVQIYVDEDDSLDGKSLYLAILEKLHAEGAAGATVTRGIAGFGAHSQVHTARFADLASSLPLLITWVDAPDRVERLLPALSAMVAEGLITVETVAVAKYAHRELSAQRLDTTVDKLMTRAVTVVRPTTPLGEIVDRMTEQRLRAVPVVDERDVVVGIITNGDLVERGGLVARLELLAALDGAAPAAGLADAPARTAADIMTRDPVTIGPDAPSQQAVELMLQRGLKRLLVVDVEGRLLGILSRVDVLRVLGQAFPAPDGEPPLPRGPASVVGDAMSRYVPVVREQARLAEVVDAVLSTRLHCAVVMDAEGNVRGTVTDANVLRRLDPRQRTGLLGMLMGRDRALLTEAGHTVAKDLMTQPAPTVTATTPLVDAARRMVEEAQKLLVVVDPAGKLLGLLDRAQLLAAARPPSPLA
jgi:CBS domain-containing protein